LVVLLSFESLTDAQNAFSSFHDRYLCPGYRQEFVSSTQWSRSGQGCPELGSFAIINTLHMRVSDHRCQPRDLHEQPVVHAGLCAGHSAIISTQVMNARLVLLLNSCWRVKTTMDAIMRHYISIPTRADLVLLPPSLRTHAAAALMEMVVRSWVGVRLFVLLSPPTRFRASSEAVMAGIEDGNINNRHRTRAQ